MKHEAFLKALNILCIKHKITWIEIERMWIDGEMYKLQYDAEDGEILMLWQRTMKALEIDASNWPKPIPAPSEE